MTERKHSDIIQVDLKSTKGDEVLTDTKKVRELIRRKGLKMSFIADMMGLSRYALSMKLENKNEFKSSEIAALCDLLDINSLEQKEAIFFAKNVDLKSTNKKAG